MEHIPQNYTFNIKIASNVRDFRFLGLWLRGFKSDDSPAERLRVSNDPRVSPIKEFRNPELFIARIVFDILNDACIGFLNGLRPRLNQRVYQFRHSGK